MAEIDLIVDDAALRRLVAILREQTHIAVDTEFHRERTYFAQLALVQIAWPGGIALIDPLALDITPLAAIFDGDVRTIMHAARQDLEVLERSCGVIPRNLVDTQLAAGFLGYTSPSLATLLERELGVALPKADRLTDWLQRPLTDAQLRYAAADVAHLVELDHRLSTRLDEQGRTAWFDEAMAELVAEPRGARDPQEAWRRIKELRHLKGRDLGVARSVAAWRETQAIELDLTPRFVLSDLGVVGVAVARPTTVDELRRIRGVDGRTLRTAIASGLLESVASAAANPPRNVVVQTHAELPTELRPALPLVSAWVGQLARDLHMELALLATRADLEALLRGDEDARLATGWRAELVGEPIRRLLGGEAALAFERSGGLVLEVRADATTAS